MVNWIIMFFLLAVIFAILVFTDIGTNFLLILKALAISFLILFFVSLIYSIIKNRNKLI